MTRRENYFNMHRLALRIGGISVGNESNAYLMFSLPFLFIVCAYPFIALVGVFNQDFETVADLLKYEFTLFVGVIKIITLRLNRINVGKILEKLEREPFLENVERGGDKEKQLIKQCNLITNIQTAVYWGVTFTIYLLDVLYTLVKRINSSDYHNWLFPFGSFNVFDATRSPNYELSWLYQSFCCGCIGLLFSIVDSTIAAVLVHICFQLKILQNHFSCIVKNSYERMLKERNEKANAPVLKEAINLNGVQVPVVEWKYLSKSLKEAVDYHLAIINIVDDMNESFGTLLLLIFLGTLAILSVMVYRASMISMSDSRLAGTLGEIMVVTLQVVLVCFWSEQVMFESEEVGAAAFQSDFVGTDLRFQQGLTLIIRRSQTPLKFTAGKFVDIGLVALTRIVRSTYSAFMVLRKRNMKS